MGHTRSFSNKHRNVYNKLTSTNPVYGAGIRTHNLYNMRFLPWSLDQGGRPASYLDSYVITTIALYLTWATGRLSHRGVGN